MQIQQSFAVERTVQGSVTPACVFVYSIPDFGVIERLESDPAYAVHVPTRNRLFAFESLVSLQVTPLPGGGMDSAAAHRR